MSKELISHHSFLFPFRWDLIAKRIKDWEFESYDKRTDLKQFDRFFTASSPLKRKYFEIASSTTRYSEYNYYYPFVRDILFAHKDNMEQSYYELEAEEGTYNISLLKEGNALNFELELKWISLHAFETGVGVLSFHLENYKYASPEEILLINDFGRRIYPQYMTDDNRLAAQDTFLPLRISGQLGDISFYEDFSQYRSHIKDRSVFLPPDHIRVVFGCSNSRLGDGEQSFIFRQSELKPRRVMIAPIMDDRMYFICYYSNSCLIEKMKKEGDITDAHPHEENKVLSDFWYQYLFGDGKSISVADPKMQLEDIRKHSYTRWLRLGSLIGITRDSTVYLSDFSLLREHARSHYYLMAVLCLMQRACILRFNAEEAMLTKRLMLRQNEAKKGIKTLYRNYLNFLNRHYFREVSSQIQGMEMYDCFQNAMNIEKEAKSMDSELSELFDYLSIDEQSKLNNIANLYLPLTLLASVLGINSFADKGWVKQLLSWGGVEDTWSLSFGDAVTAIVVLVCLFFPIRAYFKNKH